MKKNKNMVAETPKPRTLPRNFYRFGYAGFVLAGIAFAIMGKFADSAMFCGLALVFDPFNQHIPFNKRPLWQRAVLILHLAFTLTFFVLALIK